MKTTSLDEDGRMLDLFNLTSVMLVLIYISLKPMK